MMAEHETLAQLRACLADLDGFIERRAQELANPLIQQAHAEAAEQVRAAQFEWQRQKEVVAELRCRVRARDRQTAHWREVAEGTAGDFIVRWDEVCEGDRVIDSDHTGLVTVLGVDVYDDHLGISVVGETGRRSYLDVQPGQLTAVRRSLPPEAAQ